MALTIGGGPQIRILIFDAGAGHFSCEKNVTTNVHQRREGRKEKYESNLNHISRDKPNPAGPAFWRTVEHVVDSEVIVDLRELVQFVLQQNVSGVDIGENQVNLCFIIGVPEDGPDYLEHRCDSGSTGNHSESLDHVWSIDEMALGTFDANGLSGLEAGNVLGDVSSRVGLD